MKRNGEKIVGVVVWDYQMAQIVDRAAVEIISVGDSVGLNLWGQSNPLEVTMDQMVTVAQAVRRRLPAAERKQRIEHALETVGLASRMKHLPAQLSGGQQQRVAIARAIAGEPKFILADEPTGNLDTVMAHQVIELLEEIHAGGATIVMVTHDPELANRAERIIHLMDGHVLDGPAQDETLPNTHEDVALTDRLNGGNLLSAQL